MLWHRNKGACVPSVLLLRHGAHDDVGSRLTGRAPDGGLTERGRGQVRVVATVLETAPPTALYASPRRRTQETAGMIAQHFGLKVETVSALDEVDFGAWTGRTFDDLACDPRWAEWNAHRAFARCPGGESQAEAQARALAFAFEAAARSERPLLVTHCDIIRALHCWSERRSLNDIHAIDCAPASLSSLDLVQEVVAA